MTGFRPDARGTYLDRPNRFTVRVLVDGNVVAAHCPNPGRLTELLFPGDPVVLERAPKGRKLPYTLAAVERLEAWGPVTIPLVSVRANAAVGELVLPLLFPGARSAKSEFTLGRSRFDWFVEDSGGRAHLLEVKACSEVEYGVALFPDAPSLRARKHLEELAEWGDQGYQPHVVFAVGHGRPRSWGPNVHTDPGFAQTLARLAPRLALHAVVFESLPDGTVRLADPDLPVDLSWPCPDSGHLVTLTPVAGGWEFTVIWCPSALDRAVARFPARQSYAIRGAVDRRTALEAELAATLGPRTQDPRTNRAFIDIIMRWRHTAGGQQ